MYSFLAPSPATVDKNPISHTVTNSVNAEKKPTVAKVKRRKLTNAELTKVSAGAALRLKNR